MASFARGGRPPVRRKDSMALVPLRPCLLLLGVAACNIDNGLKGVVEETGFVGGDTADRFGPCIEMDKIYEFNTSIDGICKFYNDDGVSLDGKELTGLFVAGTEGTAFPDGLPVQVFGDEDGVSISNSYPLDPHYTSGELTAEVADTGGWRASATDTGDLGTLTSCGTSCNWEWLVTQIADPDRAANGTCYEYRVPHLYVCLQGHSPAPYWPVVRVAAETSSSATCRPGSGRFRLLRTRKMNLDQDLDQTYVLRPIQLSGSGTLTADARITLVTPLEEWGDSLQVLRGDGARAEIGFDDRAYALSGGVTTVRTPWSSFVDGDLPGGTMFVLQERTGASVAPVDVDLEWSCSPRFADMERELPQGYSFTLSDLGCSVDIAQRFTFRVGGVAPRRWLRVELYGVPEVGRTILLSGVPGSERFATDIGSLHVEGRLSSESKRTGAGVALDSVSYRGVSVCEPGAHVVGIEQ